jgi:hypothetical protein
MTGRAASAQRRRCTFRPECNVFISVERTWTVEEIAEGKHRALHRWPTNLVANERFNTDFGVTFDIAIAQSVFTHVSLNHIATGGTRPAR